MSRHGADQEPPQDVDQQYRRASALDPSRPSESVRRAVLAHAAELAAQRAAAPADGAPRVRRLPGRARWRAAIFGTLAAAALATLVVAPQLFVPHGPKRLPPSPGVPSAGRITEPHSSAAAPPAARLQSSSPAAAAAPPPMSRNTAQAAPVSGNAGAPAAADQASAPRSSVAMSPATRAEGAAASRVAHAPQAQSATAAAFRRAAETGDLAALAALRPQQADLDARDASGRSALMLATLHGQTRAVEALLAYGADPNAVDATGRSPLEVAREADQPAIIGALLRYGARR